MTVVLFYYLYLKSIMMSLLFIPTLFFAGVLGSYHIVMEWTQGEFRTLSSHELWTVTECMMFCSENNECQLIGTKQLNNRRLKCFLLKKLKTQGHNFGNNQGNVEEKSVLSAAARTSDITLVQEVCDYH